MSLLDRPSWRTFRDVFWTSEENGSPGGRIYAANRLETSTFLNSSLTAVSLTLSGIRFTERRRAQEDPTTNLYEFLTFAGEHSLGRRKDLSYKGVGKFFFVKWIWCGYHIIVQARRCVRHTRLRPTIRTILTSRMAIILVTTTAAITGKSSSPPQAPSPQRRRIRAPRG